MVKKSIIRSNLIFVGEQDFNSLNKITSTFFTFALTFIMPQVSGSDLHKHEKWLQRVKL